MRKCVKFLLQPERQCGRAVKDLNVSDDSVLWLKKFPFDVYFSDKTRSDEIGNYHRTSSCVPEGVVIGNTVYGFPYRAFKPECGFAGEYCKIAFGNGLAGMVPTLEQIIILQENFELYNKISEFFGTGFLKGGRFAIASEKNSKSWQVFYDSYRSVISGCRGPVFVLPVINLAK